jgi:hypothetical protein
MKGAHPMFEETIDVQLTHVLIILQQKKAASLYVDGVMVNVYRITALVYTEKSRDIVMKDVFFKMECV